MDRSAFDTTYEETRGPLFAFLARFLGCRHEAEEVFQESYLALYRRWPAPEKPKAYLFTIARNQALDCIRRRGREPLRAAVDWEQVAGPETQEESGIQQALAGLSEEKREAFLLKHSAGLSYGEISKVLGLSPGTVASRIHHAIRELKKKMERVRQEHEVRRV